MTMKRKRIWIWWCAVAMMGLLFLSGFSFAAQEANDHYPIGVNLDGWGMRGNKFGSQWTIGQARMNPRDPRQLIVSETNSSIPELINAAKGGTDIFTKKVFGDCTVELEMMVPKGSNSGIYLMGRYEIQIKDSFEKGRLTGPKEMGAICGFAKPKVNAADEPGAWQKLVIVFKAPRFTNKKRTQPAEFIKVVLNDQVIHKKVKMTKGASSGALKKKECALGPLMFQGGLGAVAFRNIKITDERQ